MNKIKVNIIGNDLDYSRSPMHGNSWGKFIELLVNQNFQIEFNNYVNVEFDALICFNYVNEMKYCKSIFSDKIAFKTLVVLEPRVVHPLLYSEKILKNFDMVISSSPQWQLNPNQFIVKYPLVVNYENFVPIRDRTIKTAMIQSNKFSCIKGEQYTLRREVIKTAIKDGFPLTLAGVGWEKSRASLSLNVSKYFLKTFLQIQPQFVVNPFRHLISNPSNWIGPVEDKIEFLKNVKQSVVIENSKDYISEKLIDAFRSGSIPFYVGPNLSAFDIPDHLVIKCEPNKKNIIGKLHSLNDFQLQQIQDNIQDFLSNNGLRHWDTDVASLEICSLFINECQTYFNQE